MPVDPAAADARSQTSNLLRRAAQKTVLDARQRLTSSSGTRASFDFELMQDYAESRLSAALPMAAIVAILSIVATFWVPPVFTALWAGMVLLSMLIVVLMAQRFKRSDPAKFNAGQWTTNFVAGETVLGLAWSLLALFTLVANPETLTPVMFAMVLVAVAANAVTTHTLPPATLMSTLPVTLTVSGNLIALGGTLNYTLAAVAVCGEIFFVYLARQLHASELETITHQAEKDALINELEEAWHMSDEARRHAEQANIAKSQFLATMSHELRTPLTSIIGNAELMELVPQNVDDRRLSLRAIKDSGRHLLTLINELLDLSRIEVGKYELDEEAVALVDVVEDCRRIVEVRANAKGIALVCEYSSDLPKLWGDGRAIRQVVLNLLSNAIKFTPPHGKIILVVARGNNGGQLVSIKDNGPGIPEDEIETVLSSFGQGSLAQKTAEQGAGLGLAIVQRIMELHQGRFDLFSKLRFGTEVIATFPRARVMSSLAPRVEAREYGSIHPELPSQPPESRLSNDPTVSDTLAGATVDYDRLLVLVVEDDPSIMHVISSIGRSAGHEISTAPDGETASLLLKKQYFDCVLMDINLPGIRGIEVKQAFDAGNPPGPVPIFFAVTGDASPRQRSIYEAAGFRSVIEKPFESEDILAAFAKVLRSRAERPIELNYPGAIDVGRMAKLERSLNREEFIESLLQAGVSLTSSRAALAEAVEVGDLLGARKACHRIAGTAGQYGLMSLHEQARRIEVDLDTANAESVEGATAPVMALIGPAVEALDVLRTSR